MSDKDLTLLFRVWDKLSQELREVIGKAIKEDMAEKKLAIKKENE